MARSSVYVQPIEARLLFASLISANLFDGASGNETSTSPSVSADGRYVAFVSASSDLTAGVSSSAYGNVYVRDRETNTTELVSASPVGLGANGACPEAQISADGRYVVFTSRATNLTSTPTGGFSNVYVRDLVSDVTTLVSISADGTRGANRECDQAQISSDGRSVVYTTAANNLPAGVTDANGGLRDVYWYDLTTGITKLISIASSGTNSGSGESFYPQLSSDGRYVSFTSSAGNLVSNDTNGGVSDVFRRDTSADTTTLVSVAAGGGTGNNGIGPFSSFITPDGRYVAFVSYAGNLTASADTNRAMDVFLRDMVANTTTLISAGPDGTTLAGNSSWPVVSSNGRYVAFQSEARLASPDANVRTDVYFRDVQAGTTRLVSVNSTNTASSNGGSNWPVISNDGRFVVYFSTGTNLVAGITDANSTADPVVWDSLRNRNAYLSLSLSGNSTGHVSNGFATRLDLSDNGKIAVFDGGWDDLVTNDANNKPDVFAAAVPQGVVASGYVWNDADGDQRLDIGESKLAGWRIYLDVNNNATWDSGEPSTLTDSAGSYKVALPPGTHRARLVLQAGWQFTAPTNGAYSGTVSEGQILNNLSFGVRELQTPQQSIAGQAIRESNFPAGAEDDWKLELIASP